MEVTPGPQFPWDTVSIDILEDAPSPQDEHVTSLKRDYLSLAPQSWRPAALLDRAGKVIRCNHLFAGFLGLREGEVPGADLFSFVASEDAPAFRDLFLELADLPGGSAVATARLRNREGLVFNAAMLLRNNEDHPQTPGLVLEILDLSGCAQAKRLMDEVHRLLSRLGPDRRVNLLNIVESARVLFEAEAAAYYHWEKGRLQATCSAEGYRESQVVKDAQSTLAFRVLRRGADEPLHVMDLAEDDGVRDPLAIRVEARSFYGQPVMLSGKVVGTLCLYHRHPRDYSRDEKQSLALIARLLSLEEEHRRQEQSLRDLIDVVSHELRHPISIVMGYTQTLINYRGKLSDEMVADILLRVLQGAKRLEHITSEILEVSRVEKGRLVVVKEEVDLEKLLEHAVDEMKAKGITKPIILHRNDLPPVMADPTKVMEVLVILLDNAAKYSPDGSPVEVTAGVGTDEVVVSVMDRGPGIPVEDRLRVFEKFYQVEEAMHHSLPGIGLGLYLAKELVEAHGGRIWCTGREGGGSIFRFTLPL
ncbi:MAG: ATP-binding protein [Candidatus Geothermincolales bacterium]